MAFGAQNTSTPAFGGFSFGTPASTTTASTFSSPFASNPASTLAGSSTGFNFGAPAATTASLFGGSNFAAPAAASSSFSFGQPTATTSTGFSFGNFGATATTSTPQLNFGAGGGLTTGLLPVASSTPAIVGLGGVDLQAASISGPEGASKKEKAIKETFIPNEILVTFEAYKKFIKDQKAIREEMSRMSNKEIFKVQSRVSSLKQELSAVSNGIQRNAKVIAKLKQDTADEGQNVEIIRSTKGTPPALQYENTAPSTYFHNLVVNFENQMQMYRQQIEQLERHLSSLSQPSTLTPNELAFVMKRLHDAFVTLAAQLQVVHQQVLQQREQLTSTLDLNQTAISNIFQSRKRATNETSHESYFPSMLPGPTLTAPDSTSSAISSSTQSRAEQQLRDLVTGNSSLLPKLNGSFGFQPNSNLIPLGK